MTFLTSIHTLMHGAKTCTHINCLNTSLTKQTLSRVRCKFISIYSFIEQKRKIFNIRKIGTFLDIFLSFEFESKIVLLCTIRIIT